MIERFYMKECVTFDEVTMEFDPGLIVFSGPSGSGKSVLMRSILGSVGLVDPVATLSESTVSWQINEHEYGLVNEPSNVLREVRREKSRFYFNNLSIPRATLSEISQQHLRHLSLKEYGDFSSGALLEVLDSLVEKRSIGFAETMLEYRKNFWAYKEVSKELRDLKEDERKLRDQKEFAEFEVKKIDEIEPGVGEYERLLDIKKSLSRKERLQEKIDRAEKIFDFEAPVIQVLDAMEIETAFFDDAMNELRSYLDETRDLFQELEEVNIEDVLARLEQLSDLKRRYGGIEEALAYREEKREELRNYENYAEQIVALQKEVDRLYNALFSDAAGISMQRIKGVAQLTDALNIFMQQLYLDPAEPELIQGDFGPDGQDILKLNLKGRPLQKVSTGEFNRLRLALLAVRSHTMQGQQGILMLDEIDANLSGEESMSVAKVLRILSRHYQIFVISHQPQLTAMGDQHFFINKNEEGSYVRELGTFAERTEEIARIVSGDVITPEARTFAKELLTATQRKANA